MVSEAGTAKSPFWLRALGAAVLALLAGSLGFAVAMALVNLGRIGV